MIFPKSPLMNSDPDAFGGGGTPDPVEPQVDSGEAPDPGTQGDPVPVDTPAADPVTPVTPTPITLDPASINQLAQTMAAQQQQQAPAEPAQRRLEDMTEAEIAQMTGQWTPDESWFTTLLSAESTPEQRLAAYGQMRQGIAREILTYAQAMIDQQVGDLKGQLEPVAQGMQQQKVAQERETFFKAYPKLRDDRYKPFLQAAAQAVHAQQPTGTLAQIHTQVAQLAEQSIKQFDPAFTLAPTKPNVTPATQSVNGSGGGTPATPAQSKALEDMTPTERAMHAVMMRR